MKDIPINLTHMPIIKLRPSRRLTPRQTFDKIIHLEPTRKLLRHPLNSQRAHSHRTIGKCATLKNPSLIPSSLECPLPPFGSLGGLRTPLSCQMEAEEIPRTT